MPKVAVYNMQGSQVGDMDLNEEVFGIEINTSLLHQAVVAKPSLAETRHPIPPKPGPWFPAVVKNPGDRKVPAGPELAPQEVRSGPKGESPSDLIPGNTASGCRRNSAASL